MSALVVLDVAIGLVFMYLLLSIVCTAVNEWVAGILRLRAGTLKKAVQRLVDEPDPKQKDDQRLSEQILKHPLICSLQSGGRAPSYIPASRFAAALKDTLPRPAIQGPGLLPPGREEALGAELGAVAPVPPLQGVAGPNLAPPKDAPARPTSRLEEDQEHVSRQLDAFRRNPKAFRPISVVENTFAPSPAAPQTDADIEAWFDQTMERATGWYKRKIAWITIAVATVLTVSINADTVVAARTLWRSPVARAAVVAQAAERAKRTRPSDARLVFQAEYPDPDRPIMAEGSSETDPDNPETANSEDDEPVGSDDVVVTDAEYEALGLITGWGADFKAINERTCRERQEVINATCRTGPEASAACTAAIDAGTAGGVCVQTGAGLNPTEVFPRGTGILRLAGAHVFGWFLTVAAVSMGAPFWFDLLNLFMNVRSSGKKPEETKPQESAR